MSSTLSLLRRAVLAVLVVVGLPQFARAATIELVSQSYNIHERVDACCPPLPEINLGRPTCRDFLHPPPVMSTCLSITTAGFR